MSTIASLLSGSSTVDLQQMDNNENGYVIGYYHCLDCGEPVNNEILAA